MQPKQQPGSYPPITATIAAIQNRCKFYNYEIWQEVEALQNAKLETQTEAHRAVAQQATNVFNIGTLHAPNSAINLGGTIHGDQVGNQSYPPEP